MTSRASKPTPSTASPATTRKRLTQHAEDAKRQGITQRELVERDRSTVRKTSNARGDEGKRPQQ